MPPLKSLPDKLLMVFGQQKRLVADRPSASFLLTLASCIRGLVLVAGVVIGAHAHASSEGASAPAQPNRDVSQWVEHMRGAVCQSPYSGTFVVMSASGAMSSSRITQACDGGVQIEKVESLTGAPRTVYRRNGEMRTFLGSTRTVRTDRADTLAVFPQPSVVPGAQLSQYYSAKRLGSERVAGRMADVLWFKPQDDLRLGYRIWSDQATGLVMKLQTLAVDGRVVEQAAFSEIDWNAPVRAEDLSRSMDAIAGFQVVSVDVRKTSAQSEGWGLRQPVEGFVPVQCYRRTLATQADTRSVLQCSYSDGLASVSLFLEPLDAVRHADLQSQEVSMGATQLLGRKVGEDAWLTVVGEVPRKTLYRFSQAWVRLR